MVTKKFMNMNPEQYCKKELQTRYVKKINKHTIYWPKMQQ